MTLPRVLKFLVVAIIVLANVGCDQVSKQIARERIADKGTIPVVDNLVILRYVENEGGFLSLGARLPRPVRIAVFIAFPLAVLAFMLVYLLASRRTDWTVLVGLSFLLGGGIGNLIDRILRDGRVADFMNVGIGRLRTGIFNAADLSVMIGCILLLLGSWSSRAPAQG